jgi:hypothetical protein
MAGRQSTDPGSRVFGGALFGRTRLPFRTGAVQGPGPPQADGARGPAERCLSQGPRWILLDRRGGYSPPVPLDGPAAETRERKGP